MEKKMITGETTSWETAKVEYEIALEQHQHYSSLRRQDMAFVTTVQAAALTIIGSKLLSLDTSGFLLSIIAFFVLLLGINSERRLSAYIAGYIHRARQIESEYGMSLLSVSWNEVQSRKLLLSNTIVFPLYYFAFILVWASIWVLNLLT
jgi:hypothetical protein